MIFITTALVAVCMTIYNVNQVTSRQAIAEPGMQRRANATMRTFTWGTSPLGALVGGAFGTLFGVPATIAIAAALVSTSALCLIPLKERKKT